MTPTEVKELIEKRFQELLDLAARKKINRSAIYMIVENEALEGARHNGNYHCWREYLPTNIWERIYNE